MAQHDQWQEYISAALPSRRPRCQCAERLVKSVELCGTRSTHKMVEVHRVHRLHFNLFLGALCVHGPQLCGACIQLFTRNDTRGAQDDADGPANLLSSRPCARPEDTSRLLLLLLLLSSKSVSRRAEAWCVKCGRAWKLAKIRRYSAPGIAPLLVGGPYLRPMQSTLLDCCS